MNKTSKNNKKILCNSLKINDEKKIPSEIDRKSFTLVITKQIMNHYKTLIYHFIIRPDT